MNSPAGDHTQLWPGFPIRTSSDQRFVDNSPRHNAVSHVLHRLSMPRHPPCALEQQTHTRITQHTNKTHTNKKQDARVHYTVLTHHTHHHQPAQTADQHEVSHNQEQPPTHKNMCRHHVLPQTPNSAPTIMFSHQRFMQTHSHHTRNPYLPVRVYVHLDISHMSAAPHLGTQPTKNTHNCEL